MKRYDAYKDSGIEWIGEIPEHWEMKRIRHVANVFGRIGYRGYTVSDLVHDGNGAITISPSNMKDSGMDFSECTYLSWEKYEESPEIKIFEGDILFVKTGSTYGKSVVVRQLPKEATINPQIVVLKDINCNNIFLWYSIKSPFIQLQVEETVVGGTIPTISQSKINNYTFPAPPPTEQTTIAHYLDHKTTEIDELIANKKRLLELYEEEKTAIINELVTGKKVWNGHAWTEPAEVKDSGIEWLGKIPKHWEVIKGKYLYNILSGFSPSTFESDGQKIEYFKVDDLNYLNRGFLLKGLGNKVEELESYHPFPEGTILFPKRGAAINLNKIAITEESCYFDTNLMGLEIISEKIEPVFLCFFISSRGLIDIADTSTIPQLNNKHIAPMEIVLPPIEEQQSIILHIETECSLIDTQMERTKKLIDLLKEYREALISEAVTGKLKVI
ncbi:MAG: restriction endonuclease subunit S [Leptospira sp.]|nr:restriction endonuclease subunit S [Leptospira sp.]